MPSHAQAQLRVRVMLDAEIALGPGKADLLEAIDRTGSISAASRELDMSYKRAWQLVDTMNRCFRNPLVATEVGGAQRGRSTLTESGREVLALYRRMEAAAEEATAPSMKAMQPLLLAHPRA
ncbi:MAG TPA: LysR family transcriptional regulator [Holophagaceae bacterium]|nr:LysR family transcriptional regulator [Holophagaceae bacterium]